MRRCVIQAKQARINSDLCQLVDRSIIGRLGALSVASAGKIRDRWMDHSQFGVVALGYFDLEDFGP